MVIVRGCVWYVVFLLAGSLDISSARPKSVVVPTLSEDGPLFEPKPSNETDKHPQKRSVSSATTNKTSPRGFFGSEYGDQDIIFPDSYEVAFESIPRIEGPPKCADGSTFCERFEPYPYHQVREVLSRNQAYKELFGEDETPNEIANRIGEEEEMFVCASISRTIFPKIGKTKNSKWKYIVNQGDSDGFVQGVRIETCRNAGGPCDIIGDVPSGYTTSCRQKYVYRRLLSLSHNGRPVPDTFQLPSACCCAYKRDLDFLARFGRPVTPAAMKKRRK